MESLWACPEKEVRWSNSPFLFWQTGTTSGVPEGGETRRESLERTENKSPKNISSSLHHSTGEVRVCCRLFGCRWVCILWRMYFFLSILFLWCFSSIRSINLAASSHKIYYQVTFSQKWADVLELIRKFFPNDTKLTSYTSHSPPRHWFNLAYFGNFSPTFFFTPPLSFSLSYSGR